jgi:hypothetical protein
VKSAQCGNVTGELGQDVDRRGCLHQLANCPAPPLDLGDMVSEGSVKVGKNLVRPWACRVPHDVCHVIQRQPHRRHSLDAQQSQDVFLAVHQDAVPASRLWQ